MESLLVGPDGKPVQSERLAPCPQCGADAKRRVPSASFGIEIYPICSSCGHEFKELIWQHVTQ